jgi:hypothetical protein
MVERSVSVDGVFESLKHGNMVLAIAEGAQTRSFVVAFYRMYVPTMRAGQKVRVIYFPSRPEDAVSIILTQ